MLWLSVKFGWSRDWQSNGLGSRSQVGLSLGHDSIEDDFGDIRNLASPSLRSAELQPKTLFSPGTRIRRSFDKVGLPSAVTPAESIRQPSGEGLQAPVPCPPEESKVHETTCSCEDPNR